MFRHKGQIHPEVIFGTLIALALVAIIGLAFLFVANWLPNQKDSVMFREILAIEKSRELAAYLSTPMPDELPELILAKSAVHNFFVEVSDWQLARDFLVNNPEVYKGRDYAEFLNNIYFLLQRDDGLQRDVFRVVTRTVFASDGPERYPHIDVIYKSRDVYATPDLTTTGLSSATQAVQLYVPLSGFSLATVRLRYLEEAYG